MPIIGIIDTAPSEIHEIMITPYCNAVKGCGGEFRLLSWDNTPETIDQYVSDCDGFVFTGGDDINPSYYGEPILPECGKILQERDEFELAFMPAVLESRKPVLAICRGFQILNVIFGGTLWQDIPSQVPGAYTHAPSPVEKIAERTHSITVIQNTLLSSLLKTNNITINSMHHQGVKELGVGLTLAAVSNDGIPEAFYLPGHPFMLAVQWHPEWLYPAEDSRILFSALIKACEVHTP